MTRDSLNTLKVALIAGCDHRPCNTCGRRVSVPALSKRTTCRPCRAEEPAA